MRLLIALIIVFVSLKTQAQESKTLFQEPYKAFTLQCYKVCDAILKDKDINVNDWYEGENPEDVIAFIDTLISDIKASKLKATYYMVLVQEEDAPFYSIHFSSEVPTTKETFGHLYLFFKDKDNTLIDGVKFLSKEAYEKEEAKRLSDTTSLKNIPPPPPPPAKKKKNGGN